MKDALFTIALLIVATLGGASFAMFVTGNWTPFN